MMFMLLFSPLFALSMLINNYVDELKMKWTLRPLVATEHMVVPTSLYVFSTLRRIEIKKKIVQVANNA